MWLDRQCLAHPVCKSSPKFVKTSTSLDSFCRGLSARLRAHRDTAFLRVREAHRLDETLNAKRSTAPAELHAGFAQCLDGLRCRHVVCCCITHSTKRRSRGVNSLNSRSRSCSVSVARVFGGFASMSRRSYRPPKAVSISIASATVRPALKGRNDASA